MSAYTHIQWTDHTWPITSGCEKISPGCRGCYAIAHSWRLAHNPNAKIAEAYAGVVERKARTLHPGPLTAAEKEKPGLNWTGTVRFLADRLDWPSRWRKPAKIFVGNMSDIFHDGISDWQLDSIFAAMDETPRHTYQILTKRTERMQSFLDRRYPRGVPKHIWPGTSVENQEMAERRLPFLMLLRGTKFISYEPALGPINWGDFKKKGGFQQIIIGGESDTPGCPPARPFDISWAEATIDFCDEIGIAPFVKQIGAHPYQSPRHDGGTGFNLAIKDKKGGDISEWPIYLRRREFPAA